MALLTLAGAQLAFGHVARLDHADFALEVSERVGLIGRNGAGKSSLLKILGGLLQPEDGTLHVQQGLRIAYVAQEPQLDADQSVFESASQGLAEAIAFGQRAGLDMPAVLDVIGKGAAQSWQMDNRGRSMVEGRFDFGFAVDWMRKDLGLVLAEAQRNGARLPVTALVDQFYADVQQAGGRRWDTSSLVTRLK